MQTLTINDYQILCSLVFFAAALFISALVMAFQAGYEKGYRAGARQQRQFGRLKLEERE